MCPKQLKTNIKLIIHMHVRVSSDAENLVKIGPVPKTDSGGGGRMETRGTKAQTALVKSSLPYSRRQRHHRHLRGCGVVQKSPPLLRKLFDF